MPPAKESLKEVQLNDFEDRFVPEAETCVRFLGVVTGSQAQAFTLTKLAFQELLDNFQKSSEEPDAKLACLKVSVEQYLSSKNTADGILAALSPQERVAVALMDGFGLSVEEVSETLGVELVTTRSLLAAGRVVMLQGSFGPDAADKAAKQKTLVAGYIGDFLADEISAKKIPDFNKALASVDTKVPANGESPEGSSVVNAFVALRDMLAAERAVHTLSMEELETIRTLAEDPVSILAREHKVLELLAAAESKQKMLRVCLALFVLFGLCVVFLSGKNSFEHKAKAFDPLLYLGNETEAFEYDYRNRLDFAVKEWA